MAGNGSHMSLVRLKRGSKDSTYAGMTLITSARDEVSNSYWLLSRVTAPDADTILETTANNSHNIGKEGTINLSTGITYISEGVCKSVNGRVFAAGVYTSGFSAGYEINFDTVNGVLGTVTTNYGGVIIPVSSTITPVNGGFYRCRFSFTVASNITGSNLYWGIQQSAGSSGTYVGDITKGLDISSLGLYSFA